MKQACKASKFMTKAAFFALSIVSALFVSSCAPVNVGDSRTAEVPAAARPMERFRGINERRDPVTRVRLGRDVLVPQPLQDDPLPDEEIGPFELRNETLASALQLILDDYEVTLAFESDRAMTTRITVANLRGHLDKVVDRVCQLANLYCHYADGIMTIKDTEVFVVDLPPLAAMTSAGSNSGGGTDTASADSGSSGATSTGSYQNIAQGLQAIIGSQPTIDDTTRVMVYSASQKTQKYAEKYFERLRKNTALIIFETHIWEVTLNNENRTGIDWSGLFENRTIFDLNVDFAGGAPTGVASPITITPTYTGSSDITSSMVLEFIAEQGNVRTVSQPQITVLSGSSASLQVQQRENYVSDISRETDDTTGDVTVTAETSTVETGLSMSITSAWDRATVYGTLAIQLDELLALETFTPSADTELQLPKTTARSLQTQIRVRPGDAVLIGGLVTEKDDYTGSGPGLMKPVIETARKVATSNTELVFLLRPRVVSFVFGDESDNLPIADAPKAGFEPDNLTKEARSLMEQASSAASLPSGISANALAPVAPVTEEEDSSPVPLMPEDSAEDMIINMTEEAADDTVDPVVEHGEAQEAVPATQQKNRSWGGLNQ
jgi:hypothetical protein